MAPLPSSCLVNHMGSVWEFLAILISLTVRLTEQDQAKIQETLEPGSTVGAVAGAVVGAVAGAVVGAVEGAVVDQ